MYQLRRPFGCMQAEAAAAEADAGSREHLEDLRARMEARERWLATERSALDAKVVEATAPAAAQRDARAAAVAALRSEVDKLRCASRGFDAARSSANVDLLVVRLTEALEGDPYKEIWYNPCNSAMLAAHLDLVSFGAFTDPQILQRCQQATIVPFSFYGLLEIN